MHDTEAARIADIVQVLQGFHLAASLGKTDPIVIACIVIAEREGKDPTEIFDSIDRGEEDRIDERSGDVILARLAMRFVALVEERTGMTFYEGNRLESAKIKGGVH
jgi:hypothetical protein